MRRNNLQTLVLSHGLGKMMLLLDSNPLLVCHHIYREYNNIADALSKKTLLLEQGMIFWPETTIREGSMNCYEF